jgi:hypothetical protein
LDLAEQRGIGERVLLSWPFALGLRETFHDLYCRLGRFLFIGEAACASGKQTNRICRHWQRSSLRRPEIYSPGIGPTMQISCRWTPRGLSPRTDICTRPGPFSWQRMMSR